MWITVSLMTNRSARFFDRVSAWLFLLSCASVVTALAVWPAGHAARTTDRNGDGRPDIWRFYDNRGRLVEVDVDSNFDGTPDIEEYYERGALVRRESDRNFNGQADLVEEFDADTHRRTRSVIDADYDGLADHLVLFRDGRPVFSKQIRSPQPSANPTPRGFEPAAGRHLARFTDPFERDTAVRSAHTTSTDEGDVGLSTSGGLPGSRLTTFGRRPPSVRFVVPDVNPPTLPLPLVRSPRAPPIA